jgi:hypothetical protein
MMTEKIRQGFDASLGEGSDIEKVIPAMGGLLSVLFSQNKR